MEWWHVVILALVQALTEFLPVSSSGHLGLVGFFLGWPYQGISFDLALHAGTLGAVVIYYWNDLWAIAQSCLHFRRNDGDDQQNRKLALILIIGTIPAVIVGLAMGEEFANTLRTPVLIAVNLIVFGLVLWAADRFGGKHRQWSGLSWKDGLLIGIGQASALIPGISRSGITMTVALGLGMNRVDAARFSFLLSVPITIAACAHGALNLFKGDEAFVAMDFLLGAAVALASGLAVMHFLLSFLKRAGMLPFVVYRIALGVLVLLMVGQYV
ncbi:undecaprenyl-diphosphate phosphatase [Ahniella affigens]|uniref:Undecaprenyl-diphosphatase n=1 Tax=Ahniella affigens TaxID=2021234 RepID=A0A2P1PS75_9GAMM|nr:undecaprenyl-diphosphate phosphatase [Ahniella affigens]AVP97706.1 undecaprenyl-diphosphate phosphatase [Ahniella affigens]